MPTAAARPLELRAQPTTRIFGTVYHYFVRFSDVTVALGVLADGCPTEA
jgi:hypothetical protein